VSVHHRATANTTYCGLSVAGERHTTRWQMLSTCGRCYAVERFYSHMGLDVSGWQREIMVLLMSKEQRGETVYVRKPRKS
jgi:hypothetical protein